MKKTILRFLVIVLFVQSQGLNTYASESSNSVLNAEKIFDQASLLDMDSLENLLESGRLSQEQHDNYMDILESGGDTLRVTIPKDRLLTPEQELLVNETQIKDISAATTVQELQKFAETQVAGYGQWGFSLVYIGNNGIRKDLTSLNQHIKIRPASTMKLFSANLAYDRKAYSQSNLGLLLQKSKNGMADAALRATANLQPNYRVPEGSYLRHPDLLNYKMYDSTENKNQIIDVSILRGCSMMNTEYAGLEDSSKFHPVNGSGLQVTGKDTDLQTNTVTPRLQTALLERILSNKTKYEKYKNLLTSPGKAGGTLTSAFTQGRKLAKIYAKTGTLGNGKALAGFAETKNGVLVFSIISDKLRALSTTEALKGPIENIVYNHLAYLKAKGL